MSNFSTFFPVPGGGGGGGILNEEVFTTSGSFDPAAKGLSIGDKVSLFICGGGGGGNTYKYNQATGGSGGLVKQGTFTLTSTSVIPVNIGAGGTTTAANGAFGGVGGLTSVSGSGVSLAASGGNGGWSSYSPSNSGNRSPGMSVGPHWGATAGQASNYGSASSAGPGINGYGAGGFAKATNTFNGSGATSIGTYAMQGTGGGSGTGGGVGMPGIVKIYY